ncbi:hypothetical protein [Azospirillum argentinense]
MRLPWQRAVPQVRQCGGGAEQCRRHRRQMQRQGPRPQPRGGVWRDRGVVPGHATLPRRTGEMGPAEMRMASDSSRCPAGWCRRNRPAPGRRAPSPRRPAPSSGTGGRRHRPSRDRRRRPPIVPATGRGTVARAFPGTGCRIRTIRPWPGVYGGGGALDQSREGPIKNVANPELSGGCPPAVAALRHSTGQGAFLRVVLISGTYPPHDPS